MQPPLRSGVKHKISFSFTFLLVTLSCNARFRFYFDLMFFLLRCAWNPQRLSTMLFTKVVSGLLRYPTKSETVKQPQKGGPACRQASGGYTERRCEGGRLLEDQLQPGRVDGGAGGCCSKVLLLQVGDAYWKDPDHPAEDNWVWSPQGEIQMHLPER